MRILPILGAYLALWRVFFVAGSGVRQAAIQAAVLWMTALIFVTELLSAGAAVTANTLALAWSVVLGLGVVYLVRQPRRSRIAEHADLAAADWIILGGAALSLVLIGILAVVAAPNTWDSMEYHLPRVILWISNHSVRQFATPDYAQLVFGPAAEFAMLHLHLLWGSDRLVNLVEFFSFVATIVGVSLIAQRFGAGTRGQIFAAVIVATLPEAVLEASGSMNTLVVTFWIVATVYFMLSAAQDSAGWGDAILAALSVGIAMLAKGSAYIYLPFVLLACWWIGSAESRLRMLRRVPVLAVIVLIVNLPQFWRSYDLTGSPLGLPFPDGGPRLSWMNARISPGSVAANIIRNSSLHMVTPSEAVNNWTQRVIRRSIELIGQDPDDPANIWPGRPFSMSRRSLHEIWAGNTLQFALITVVFLLVMIRFRNLADSNLRWYVAAVFASFVLFCGLLRWQEWESRHHLPLFALSASAVGVFLGRMKWKRAGVMVALVLLVSAIPFVLLNKIRSYVRWSNVVDVYRPRTEVYFADAHLELTPVYQRIADEVHFTGCRDVGIDSYVPIPAAEMVQSDESLFVYPLFAMLKVDGNNLRVRYVGVQNLSAKYAKADEPVRPCVVVCLACDRRPDTAAPPYVAQSSKVISIAEHRVFSFEPDAKAARR